MAMFTKSETGSLVSLVEVKKELEKFATKNLADRFEEYEGAQNEELEKNKLALESCKSDIADIFDRLSEIEDSSMKNREMLSDLDFVTRTNIKGLQNKIARTEEFNIKANLIAAVIGVLVLSVFCWFLFFRTI